jgi:hypothetical protein
MELCKGKVSNLKPKGNNSSGKKLNPELAKSSSEEDEEQVSSRPVSPQPPKLLSRRSFSLDEGSLLTYSTSAAQSTDSIENSIQNSKKREECLKIYEKMNKGGCAVRLQTIFR